MPYEPEKTGIGGEGTPPDPEDTGIHFKRTEEGQARHQKLKDINKDDISEIS